MASTPTPRTVALRDRILLILRDNWPLPISTREVLRAMTNGGNSCNSYNADRGQCPRPTSLRPDEPCFGWCWQQAVYPQLRAMEHLGLVELVRIEGHRAVYWRYVEQETDREVDAILAAMEGHR